MQPGGPADRSRGLFSARFRDGAVSSGFTAGLPSGGAFVAALSCVVFGAVSCVLICGSAGGLAGEFA